MTEIIFCPFCDSVYYVVTTDRIVGEKGWKYYVECKTCGANGPIKDNSADALLEWSKVADKVNDPVYREGGKF